MRCKKHPADLSSTVGVCATCLRGRLFALIAAQARAQSQPQPPPPPLAFPRSVSPYVSRRKSDDDRRFRTTPQVVHVSNCLPPTNHNKKDRNRKLSLFFHLFRSRSEKFHPRPDPRVLASPVRDSSRTSSSSPSWFSFIPGRRRGPSRLSSMAESDSVAATDKKSAWVSNRGMSPARGGDCDADLDDRSPSGSGYSSESSQPWRKTPAAGTTPASATRRPRPAYARNMSGIAFCLSPLVRASPGRRRKQHQNGSALQQEIGFSGEIRASPRPHISTAASFCANRSRKLADFGRRTNHNR